MPSARSAARISFKSLGVAMKPDSASPRIAAGPFPDGLFGAGARALVRAVGLGVPAPPRSFNVRATSSGDPSIETVAPVGSL
jgi:hypothetical protein